MFTPTRKDYARQGWQTNRGSAHENREYSVGHELFGGEQGLTLECALQITIKKLEFSRAERKIYDAIYDKSRRAFIKMDQEGQIKSAYTSILAMLMKLRQAVDHPLLVMNRTAGSEETDDILTKSADTGEEAVETLIAKFAQGSDDDSAEAFDPALATQVLKKLSSSSKISECTICHGEVEAEVILSCWHTACRDCVQNLIETAEDLGKKAMCPECDKGPLTLDSLKEVKRSKNTFNGASGAASLGRVDFQTSTKLKALVASLQSLEQEDPLFKALVFSQVSCDLRATSRYGTANQSHIPVYVHAFPHRASFDRQWYRLSVGIEFSAIPYSSR